MIDDKTRYLIDKYDRPVPRYTSFPTAVQFSETSAALPRQAELLQAAAKSEKPLSLYIHIPFCHSLCHYCGCNTTITNTYRPIARYIETLLKEIDLIGASMTTTDTEKPVLARIHFGGGSPNYAPSDDLLKIISRLSRYFDISPSLTQIDMECDPRLLSAEKIARYADMGITRISLGIQDFDANVQRAINREQPYEMVARCVENLHKYGIDGINFDLITGLPAQTMETVERTVEQALTLSPSRLAVFAYAHVPWMKKHQKLLERYHLPQAEERFAMNALVSDRLTASGYQEIGIDHFARAGDPLLSMATNGTMRRNFQGYTDDEADVIIGVGLSSISNLDQAYIQNVTDAPAYHDMINRGILPVKRGCALSAEDRTRRALIERVMCDFALDFRAFPDIPVPRAALETLAQDGILDLDETGFTITPRGKAFVRVVAACFDPYLKKDGRNHARAV